MEESKPNTQLQVEKPTEFRLNLAARLLLDQLPDHVGELAITLAHEYQLPLWHFMCGVILEVHYEGRLSSFQIDPAWKDGFKQKELVCQWTECGKKFKPLRIAQKFCSNECGIKAEQKEQAEKQAVLKRTQLEQVRDIVAKQLENLNGNTSVDPMDNDTLVDKPTAFSNPSGTVDSSDSGWTDEPLSVV